MKNYSLSTAEGRKKLKARLIAHLEDDILHFWSRAEIVKCNGNFPTFVMQTGIPVSGMVRFTRMQGRLTFAFLSAYECLLSIRRRTSIERYLNWGLAGIRYIGTLATPHGGYYMLSDEFGKGIEASVSIQDLSYAALPLMPAYRITKDECYVNKVWQIIDYILGEPYSKDGELAVDSIGSDGETSAYFEGKTLNLVSVLDFLNALYIPALRDSPAEYVTQERLDGFKRTVHSLVDNFFRKGIFWNDMQNAGDFRAKHVDFGHTAKGYGILIDSDILLGRNGCDPSKIRKIIKGFRRLVLSAHDPVLGWKTDFDESGGLVGEVRPSWWRHIVINQTLARYISSVCKRQSGELIDALEHGIDTWFGLGFCDMKRECRGIKESVSNPALISLEAAHIVEDDFSVVKANPWKSAYHEVDHVVTLLKLIARMDGDYAYV